MCLSVGVGGHLEGGGGGGRARGKLQHPAVSEGGRGCSELAERVPGILGAQRN